MKFLAFIFVFCAFTANAATYYIRTDGNDSNDGLANTSGGAWLTLAKAASTVVAGDTVRVQAGTYAAGMSETTDGSSGSPITYIADGTVIINPTTSPGIELVGDYIRFIGFIVAMDGTGSNARDVIYLTGSTGVELWNNTVSNHTRNAIVGAAAASGAITNALIIGNTVAGRFGTADVDAESSHISIRGYNSIVGYNIFPRANEDYMPFVGEHSRIINNYGFDPNTNSAAHVDFWQIGARANDVSNDYYTRTNLFEANLYLDSAVPADDHHLSNISNDALLTAGQARHLLSRRNISYRNGTGVQGIFEDWSSIYIIHESYVDGQRFATTDLNGLLCNDETSNARVFNSIFYEVWGAALTTGIRGYLLEGSGTVHNYNLGFDPDGSVTFAVTAGTLGSQANGQLNADPDFVNPDSDWRLGGSSQATGNAGPLTTVTSGSGTGTEFDVADAGWFRGDDTSISQYGGNLVVGDNITVGTDQLTIASISGDTITVTASFTWAETDPVFWGWDTTPDIGAYPANHVPLSAATIAQDGNDYTVTPTGDTRFVVFFQDGIPHTVDNASPYTATISSGTVTARAYALYASSTPTVLATESQPAGPRIWNISTVNAVNANVGGSQ